MDSETRKVIFQLRKIADQGESTEDEDMTDIDDDVDFEDSDREQKLVGDPKIISQLASMQGRELESKLISDSTKKSVLMLGEFKSGANFVSQIINQRSDALYLFEPLSPFGTSCNKEKEVKTHVLYQLNKCKFPNQEEIFAKRGNSKSWTASICTDHRICFRHRSRALIRPPFCKKPFPNEDKLKQAEALSKCGPVNIRTAEEYCQDAAIVGAKVHRICDFEEVKNLASNPNADWKFIFVVRDPRAIFASLEHAKSESGKIETLCNQLNANMNYLLNPTSSNWIKKKLLIIRFEDLLLKKKSVINNTNQFLGLDASEDVSNWFDANTKDTLNNWKTRLSSSQLQEVQKRCATAMSYLGYKHIAAKAVKSSSTEETLATNWPQSTATTVNEKL
ncbi:Oidioi.mRNA.OKI2018_I69.XSR.g15708.t1.cds [Oikopleura dioica]|uniref:Sulfotransferase n=1 Tax=Oikopleura dioica TaxID=34765 RepID=A0ABN7SHQ6_OIKDI|nr:Oidioi.mRNA.OKI2018_I69.XSR.g15708.t1.cds [Oikopleura dioica]